MSAWKTLSVSAVVLFTALPVQAATEIVVWHAYRAQEKKGIDRVATTYNAKGGDTRIKLVPIPYDAFADKITAAVPRGKGPDLFIFAQDRVGDWAASELIEPLDFWVTDEQREAFLVPTLEALTYDDQIYGLPMAFKTLALFYNTKLIKNPPKTTDELVKLAKKFTKPGKKSYGLVYENANFYYQAPWLLGFGGQVFSKRGKPTLDSAAVVDSMKFAQYLAHESEIMPEEVTSSLVTTLFSKGQAAMVINGPWFIGEIGRGVNYGVAPLPTISGKGPARPFLTAEGVIMSAKSDHKKEAFEVMAFLTSNEAATLMAKVGRQTTARKDVYDDPAIGKDPVFVAFRAQLKNATPMPNTPAMRVVWSPVTTAMNKIVNGKADPSAAMTKAQSEVNQLLRGARR